MLYQRYIYIVYTRHIFLPYNQLSGKLHSNICGHCYTRCGYGGGTTTILVERRCCAYTEYTLGQAVKTWPHIYVLFTAISQLCLLSAYAVYKVQIYDLYYRVNGRQCRGQVRWIQFALSIYILFTQSLPNTYLRCPRPSPLGAFHLLLLLRRVLVLPSWGQGWGSGYSGTQRRWGWWHWPPAHYQSKVIRSQRSFLKGSN